MLTVGFLHHSGFVIELEDSIFVFDYYLDPAGLLDKVLKKSDKPLYFFVSHNHGDHFNPSILDYAGRAEAYVLHRDCSLPSAGACRVVYMESGDAENIDSFHVKMYGSTDAGGSWYISGPDHTVFHAGDLNWWHWAGEPDADNAEARDMYREELSKITEQDVDVAMFPVDARQEVAREWGVKKFLEQISVHTLLIPMHAFGTRWNPSYEFRWTYPDMPLWIPQRDGDQWEGGDA
ncbi:MAG: MBL fold metallo-hydrolase [Dialister sp.]|nr:MBL fold metallo-hydrolase [Dialister sp.]